MKLFIAIHSSILQHKYVPMRIPTSQIKSPSLSLSLLTKKLTFPEGADQKGRQIGLLAGGKLRLLAFGEQRAACPLLPLVACLLGHAQHFPHSS